MVNRHILLIRNAAFTDFGGGERFPTFIAQSLQKCGWQGTVISRSPSVLQFATSQNIKNIKGWWWSNQDWSGFRIIFIPFYLIWQITLYCWYVILLFKTRPLALHIQSKDDFIAATLAAKTLGVNVVWTDHADLKHIFKNLYVWYKNPIGKMIYLCGLTIDALVVVSKNEKKLICANFKKNSKLKNKMVLIHNGVADNLSSYKKIKNKKFTFTIASRLVTDKGIGETIEAFKKISNTNKNTALHILGDGPESDKFKKIADGFDNIKFLGHLADPMIEMRNADVFLQPTYHEAFSVVLVEACMLELAVIATNVGGNPEIIIDGKTGLLVESRDVDSLYKAMDKLYKDSELRAKLANAARKQYVEKFNFDNIVKEQYIKLYEK